MYLIKKQYNVNAPRFCPLNRVIGISTRVFLLTPAWFYPNEWTYDEIQAVNC
jgi:hypothetical protein